MRSMEDKVCLNNEVADGNGGGGSSSCISFEFKSNGLTRSASHHRTALGKPTPSKWDDAQKWLVNISGREKNLTKASPRSSNADDRRLIGPPPVPKKEEEEEEEGGNESNGADRFDVETKTVDCEESVWRINRPVDSSKSVVRSICVRDMGTEMTPIASQEPSRVASPIRATTPAARSPVSSWTSTPVRFQGQPVLSPVQKRGEGGGSGGANVAIRQGSRDDENTSDNHSTKTNPLETRATAWDEAERARYMAR